MRKVKLYGELAHRFGREFHFDVKSPAEAVRALRANFKDFEQVVLDLGRKGYRYAVWSGRNNIGKDELLMEGDGSIRIAPVLAGRKSGWLETIAGIGLIIVGIVADVYSGGTLGNQFITMGIALTIAGIATLLSPQPQTQYRSSTFGGVLNTATQNQPAPVLYGGPMLVGGAVISAGVDVDQVPLDWTP